MRHRSADPKYLNRDAGLPDGLTEKYNILALLSRSKRSEVYLIADKETQIRYILKTFSVQYGGSEAPEAILKTLAHPCIPRFIESITDGGRVYLVREYFDGETLADHVIRKGRFGIKEALRITAALCDILSYLHKRPAPVIYRDIKAENIIITPDGGVRLVDFDISREYDTSAKKDTVYYGTKDYSPPEQFGYAQTDTRTDIYALGILLLYMLTGSTDIAGADGVGDMAVLKIVRKCTAFSPHDRYRSVDVLKKDIGRAAEHRKAVPVVWAAVLAAGFLIAGLIGGIALERGGVVPAFGQENTSVVFASPLIEQAARQALGKTDGQAVTRQELETIERLSIWGTKTLSDTQERLLLGCDPGFTNARVYYDDYSGESEPLTRGSIDTLEDLMMMPNLKRLDLVMQNLSDITPLAGLPLEELNIACNAVSDISPLGGCIGITSLNITGNPVADIAPLESLVYLRIFDASETHISDLTPLAGLYKLEYLYINDADISDVDPLAGLALTTCHLCGNDITDISALGDIGELDVSDNPVSE